MVIVSDALLSWLIATIALSACDTLQDEGIPVSKFKD